LYITIDRVIASQPLETTLHLPIALNGQALSSKVNGTQCDLKQTFLAA
jgi:hypothetical protein